MSSLDVTSFPVSSHFHVLCLSLQSFVSRFTLGLLSAFYHLHTWAPLSLDCIGCTSWPTHTHTHTHTHIYTHIRIHSLKHTLAYPHTISFFLSHTHTLSLSLTYTLCLTVSLTPAKHTLSSHTYTLTHSLSPTHTHTLTPTPPSAWLENELKSKHESLFPQAG